MEIKQSAAFKVPVKLRNSTTGAGTTGKVFSDVTVKFQKQAGVIATKTMGAGDFTEIDATAFAGVYDLLLSAGELDTVGFFKYSVALSGSETYHGVVEIVANVEADTYARIGAPVLASISADVASRSTFAGGAVASVTGSVGAVVGLTPGNLDVAVSSRLAAASYTAPDNASVTAIKAKTDNLPVNPASQTNLDVAVSSRSTFAGGAVASVTGAVGSVSGLNPALLDVAVSTRLATSGYTAPSAATVAAAVWNESMSGHTTAGTAGALLTEMSAGLGSELLTVTILNPNLIPILGVAVYCHNVSGTLVAHSITNVSGVAILAPGVGVNTVTAYFTGFSFAAQGVTIQTGVNATAQLVATTSTIPVGTSPGRCAVYARLQLANGAPAVGVIGKAHLRKLPQKLSDVFVADTAITAISAADGLISFDLPRGASCVVTVPNHITRVFVEVPDATSYALLGTSTI